MNILDFTHLFCQALPQSMLWQTWDVRVVCKNSSSLRISTKDLIPVNMRMHSTDNHNIPILGAVFLRLAGTDQSSNERTI